ncbi:hypothetical protein ACJX0J_029068, partial [Zea mays]
LIISGSNGLYVIDMLNYVDDIILRNLKMTSYIDDESIYKELGIKDDYHFVQEKIRSIVSKHQTFDNSQSLFLHNEVMIEGDVRKETMTLSPDILGEGDSILNQFLIFLLQLQRMPRYSYVILRS